MTIRATEWADYAAGRLGREREAELEALAAADEQHAAARDRALRVREAMTDIGELDSPDVAWDSAFARIHWEVSLAARRPAEQRRRWPVRVGLSAAAVAVAALGLWWLGSDGAKEPPTTQRAASPPAASPPASPEQVIAVELTGEPLVGLITLLEGSVTRDGELVEPSGLDRGLTAGTTLSTKEGRIAVQFGDASAFELGPRSSVRLVSFDRSQVVLASTGSIDVEVSHRAPEQRFVVEAGGHRVGVRGTRFRVEDRKGHLAVACTRGEVSVETEGGVHERVPAGRRLSAVDGSQPVVAAMSETELVELDAALDIPRVASWDPTWSGAAPHPSGLVGADPGGRPLVAVNGVEVGTAPLWLRVSPGRHHVAVESGGKWRPGSWSEVGAGQRVAFEPGPARPTRRRARVRRRARMIRQIEASSSVRGCVRGLEKRGLAEGAYLELEMGLGPASLHFLNVLSTDLPPEVARCVRRAVGRLELPAGPGVELRHRLQF